MSDLISNFDLILIFEEGVYNSPNLIKLSIPIIAIMCIKSRLAATRYFAFSENANADIYC